MRPSEISGAEHIADWVGLRPGRPGVRVERTKMKQSSGREMDVIHNYGHGGSGITIFWGCAKDVAKLVGEVQIEQQQRRATVSKL